MGRKNRVKKRGKEQGSVIETVDEMKGEGKEEMGEKERMIRKRKVKYDEKQTREKKRKIG